MKKKTLFGYVDPAAIMGVVVTLIILGVGAFAFFTTIGGIEDTGIGFDDSADIRQNITGQSNPITFNGLYDNTVGINSITLIYDDGSSRTLAAGEYVWSANNPKQITVTLAS